MPIVNRSLLILVLVSLFSCTESEEAFKERQRRIDTKLEATIVSVFANDTMSHFLEEPKHKGGKYIGKMEFSYPDDVSGYLFFGLQKVESKNSGLGHILLACSTAKSAKFDCDDQTMIYLDGEELPQLELAQQIQQYNKSTLYEIEFFNGFEPEMRKARTDINYDRLDEGFTK